VKPTSAYCICTGDIALTVFKADTLVLSCNTLNDAMDRVELCPAVGYRFDRSVDVGGWTWY